MSLRVLLLATLIVGVSSCTISVDWGFPEKYDTYPTNKYSRENSRCKNTFLEHEIFSRRGDIDSEIREIGRRSEWKPQKMFLGETCMVASVGPVFFTDEDNMDPDYVSIDVEVRQLRNFGDGTQDVVWLVLYNRNIKIIDLPEDFLDKDIEDVVLYDKSKNIVDFRVGNKIYKYSLPNILN